MGLFDSILNQVKDQVIQGGTQIVKNQVENVAAKEAKKVEAFALKKVAFAYLDKTTNGFNNASEEEKETIYNMFGKVIDNVMNGDEPLTATDYNNATNMIYRGLGKPEIACNTEVDAAMEEFKTAFNELKILSEKNATN